MSDDAASVEDRADTSLPNDEENLRQRLDNTRAARSKTEEASASIAAMMFDHLGRVRAALENGVSPAEADRLMETGRILTTAQQGFRDSWEILAAEETRIRSALGVLVSERLATASVRAANSTKWATWVAAVVAAASLATSLVVGLRHDPAPAPATPPAATTTP